MIKRSEVWKAVLVSWGFTLMGLFNILVLCGIAAVITIRFRGPGAVVGLIVPTCATLLALSLLTEPLINMLYGAQKPHPEKDRRFLDALRAASKRARMLVTPRPYILHLGQPNAMTYGLPLPGLAVVAVTPELVAMMTDDELEAVLGHELGHIRCRDTGIQLFVSCILGLIDKLYLLLRSGSSIWLRSPITLVVGWMIWLIGRIAFAVSQFSVSQERELAADALSAWDMGTPTPMIRALNKLRRLEVGDPNRKPLFHDLMVSHPGMDERITALKQFMPQAAKGTNE